MISKNFKSFSQSLEHFFLTVGQINFGNKIPMFVKSKKCFLGSFFSAKVYIHLEKFGHASEGGATVFIQRLSVYLPPCRVLVAHFIRYIFLIEQITFSNFGPREHSRDWMDKRGILWVK